MGGSSISHGTEERLAKGWSQTNGEIIWLSIDKPYLKMVKTDATYGFIALGYYGAEACAHGDPATLVHTAADALMHWDAATSSHNTAANYLISDGSITCADGNILPLSNYRACIFC